MYKFTQQKGKIVIVRSGVNSRRGVVWESKPVQSDDTDAAETDVVLKSDFSIVDLSPAG